jgi:hypothetical protein
METELPETEQIIQAQGGSVADRVSLRHSIQADRQSGGAGALGM